MNRGFDFKKEKNTQEKVPPRFELGLLDSESRVLTITPWDQLDVRNSAIQNKLQSNKTRKAAEARHFKILILNFYLFTYESEGHDLAHNPANWRPFYPVNAVFPFITGLIYSVVLVLFF